MKPGKMKNIANPGGGGGLSAVAATAATSLNNDATAQRSMNANRLVPPHKPMGPSGQAPIEYNNIQDGIPIFTQGTKVTQATRKRLLTLP